MDSNVRIPGLAFDGRSSVGFEAVVEIAGIAGNDARIWRGLTLVYECEKSRIQVSSRVGSAPQVLSFPDGHVFESHDFEAIAREFNRSTSLHRWENRKRLVTIATVCFLLGVGLAYKFGIPSLAKIVAAKMPQQVRISMTASTREAFQKLGLRVSALGPLTNATWYSAEVANLQKRFPAKKLEVLLVSGEHIGPNAFALPDGLILVTDSLLRLVKKPEELRAVLYHEVGHIDRDHSLRLILEQSAIGLILFAYAGDASWMALPTVLLDASYSREFETEADDFAAHALLEEGYSPSLLGDVLLRLEKEMGNPGDVIPAFLASHPMSNARMERLQGQAHGMKF